MDTQTERLLLLQELDGYVELLSQRNVTVNGSGELPEGLSLSDLRKILEHYKTLCRSPSS